jgi:hypothetical protein
MVPPLHPTTRVNRKRGRWKHPEPSPRVAYLGVFLLQRMRGFHTATLRLTVRLPHIGNEFEQFGAGYFGTHQYRLACFIHAVHGKDVLCKVDSNSYDSHDFPFQYSELMKSLTSPSWHLVAVNRNPIGARLAWDGEVPFIR